MEVVIGLGILGILVTLIINVVNYGLTGQQTVKNSAAANSYAYEIRTQLWNSAICTGNLKTVAGTSSLSPGMTMPITELKAYDSDGNLVSAAPPLTAVSVVKDDVRLESMELQIKTIIHEDVLIADVVTAFDSTKNALGPASVKRSFPIAIALKNNQFHSCGSIDGTVGLEREKICSLSSNGEHYYNELTDKCESKFGPETCYPSTTGNRFTATCPTGTKFSRCTFNSGSDPAPPVNRNFVGPSGAFPRNINYAAAEDYNSNTQQCECSFAQDADDGSWTCVACCKRQVIFP